MYAHTYTHIQHIYIHMCVLLFVYIYIHHIILGHGLVKILGCDFEVAMKSRLLLLRCSSQEFQKGRVLHAELDGPEVWSPARACEQDGLGDGIL